MLAIREIGLVGKIGVVRKNVENISNWDNYAIRHDWVLLGNIRQLGILCKRSNWEIVHNFVDWVFSTNFLSNSTIWEFGLIGKIGQSY
jgi:hypothetical protein